MGPLRKLDKVRVLSQITIETGRSVCCTLIVHAHTGPWNHRDWTSSHRKGTLFRSIRSWPWARGPSQHLPPVRWVVAASRGEIRSRRPPSALEYWCLKTHYASDVSVGMSTVHMVRGKLCLHTTCICLNTSLWNIGCRGRSCGRCLTVFAFTQPTAICWGKCGAGYFRRLTLLWCVSSLYVTITQLVTAKAKPFVGVIACFYLLHCSISAWPKLWLFPHLT